MKNLINIKFIIILLIISSCGYKPIFSSKDVNFSIEKINLEGDKKINKIIFKKLTIFKNKGNNVKLLNLEISSQINKITSSKDTKGNPKTYRLKISTNIKISELEKLKFNKNFSKSLNYNNSPNKFELKKYEEKNKENLSEEISEDIIIYLLSLYKK